MPDPPLTVPVRLTTKLGGTVPEAGFAAKVQVTTGGVTVTAVVSWQVSPVLVVATAVTVAAPAETPFTLVEYGEVVSVVGLTVTIEPLLGFG